MTHNLAHSPFTERLRKRAKQLRTSLNLTWQNLDHRPGDGWNATGHLWRHGRAWLHPFGHDNPGFRAEWCLESVLRHVTFTLDPSEGEISGGIALAPVALWWGITELGSWLKTVGPWDEHGWRGYKKDISVSFYEGDLSWTFWYDNDHWAEGMPWWRNGCFSVIDFLLGDTEHSEETVEGPVEVLIPMPERAYKGTAEMKRETWKHPRLPWKSLQLLCAHIETDKDPVPFPGKGTMPYNCGEDATYGMTTTASSIADAVGKMVGSILRDRERYGGGIDWRPEEDHRPKKSTGVEDGEKALHEEGALHEDRDFRKTPTQS